MTVDVSGATTIYYCTYVGNQVPVGGVSLTIGSDQVSMGLDAGTPHVAANNVYDVFAINNSGTLVIAVGPAWLNTATVTTTVATPCVVNWTGHGLAEGAPVVFTGAGLPSGITAGTTYFVSRSPGTNSFNISTSIANAAAGTLVNTTGTSTGTQTGTNGTTSRGTGAGTTELQLSGGVWTNKNALTHAWGGASGTTDYGSVSANAATYLGSFFATANGQTSITGSPARASGGGNNMLAVYNAYNRVSLSCFEGDSTVNWSATTTWRAMNNNVLNRISFLDGLGQSAVEVALYMDIQTVAGTAGACGVSFDSTNAVPISGSTIGYVVNANEGSVVARAHGIFLGWHYAQAQEARLNGASTCNFQNQIFTSQWSGGMFLDYDG